jgi:TonB dependent receptor/CarboxypepD_reg-like domain/TonB-dependent Receptor Plug Domain
MISKQNEMRQIPCRWLFVVLYFLHLPAYGQKDTTSLITVNFDKAVMQDFLNSVEEQTSIHFFYDTADFDTVRITIHASHQQLRQVLDQAFSNTDIYYAADGENHWFLTRGNAMDFSFTPGTPARETRIKKNRQEAEMADEEDVVEKKSWIEYKVFEIGDKGANSSKSIVTIDGFVKDAKTGEPLTGASVSVEKSKTGVATDQYGYYSLSLPRGRYVLDIQNIGMKDTRRQIILHNDGKLNIEMQQTIIRLKKVIISGQKQSNVRGTYMGVQKLDIKTIKQVPIVFGETDILRVTTTLPGVKTVGESSTGLNVRGGAADQNLILFNDATIYNPSHFFGMFSAFNPDVVNGVELYKSSIPAKYGGRLSSVLDITSREGNKKEFAGTAGIGALTSRLEIEGPLIKDKSSFIIAGRTTYSDWLLNLLPNQYKNSRASFYDINLNISQELNKNNSLYLTGYISQDHFNLNSDTTYSYGNNNISLKWKHIFNNKLNGVVTGGYDSYKYKISSESIPPSAYSLAFSVNQYYLNADYNYYYSTRHTFNFGINSLFYKLHPGSYQPIGDQSIVAPDEMVPEQALNLAIYVSDHFTVNPALSIDAGIRFSNYNYLGPQNVNEYVPGMPKSESSLVKTVSYGSASVIKSYSAPEYRLSVRYAFNESSSIKAGFNTQHQYIHSLSNTSSMAPTDIWKLSDPNIRPQSGEQVSLGFYKNLKSNTIETSVEVYYKTMKNYLDYTSGAVLVMNPHIETDVVPTTGKAYGVEFFIKKLTGKLNGWISYTWSRTFLRMNDPTQGQLINNGAWYPANYDMPNDVAVVANYRINHRFSLSFNATYSTGRPITLPSAIYTYSGSVRTLYTDRNAYRIPDYFRTDFAMNIDGNHKVHQKIHTSWTIGVYNMTGRKNPYSVYFVSENGVVKGYKLSIFGSAIPFLNFNLRF